jgi:hypothetical protein
MGRDRSFASKVQITLRVPSALIPIDIDEFEV